MGGACSAAAALRPRPLAADRAHRRTRPRAGSSASARERHRRDGCGGDDCDRTHGRNAVTPVTPAAFACPLGASPLKGLGVHRRSSVSERIA
jgi:hypothetical protein